MQALYVNFVVTPHGLRAAGMKLPLEMREELDGYNSEAWKAYLSRLHESIEFDSRESSLPILLSFSKSQTEN